MIELGSVEFWARIRNDPARLAWEICSVDVSSQRALDETLQRHPALRAWINAEHETARIAEERAKWKLTVTRARAFLDAQGPVEERKAKADAHQSVQDATEELFQAQEKRGALRAMADALEDRVQMLIQISAKQRQEAKDSNR